VQPHGDAADGQQQRPHELGIAISRHVTQSTCMASSTPRRRQAAQTAAEHAAELARRKGADEHAVAERAAQAAATAVPKPKAQRNFTDPDSKIMKTSDGSFAQCYNAQAVRR
jgi:hypothetical protein